jgi:hypothetical protein
MVYFDGCGKKILKDAIETIQYPEIDVDHLISAAATSEKHAADLAGRYPRVWSNQLTQAHSEKAARRKSRG